MTARTRLGTPPQHMQLLGEYSKISEYYAYI